MDEKVQEFLNLLESEENKELIDTVRTGISVIMEGYADVVSDRNEPSTMERFNNKAANLAASMGNHLLHFLMNSSNVLKSKFSIDGEPELDRNPTTVRPFNQYQHTEPDRRTVDSIYVPEYDEISDSLGLTISEVNNQKI